MLYTCTYTQIFIYLFIQRAHALFVFYLKKETRNHTDRKKDISYKEQVNKLRTCKLEKKPHKNAREQLCVNIWWYAGSELQSEVFALFFLTLTNIIWVFSADPKCRFLVLRFQENITVFSSALIHIFAHLLFTPVSIIIRWISNLIQYDHSYILIRDKKAYDRRMLGKLLKK